MGRHIEPQTKQIILKVIQFCEEEKKKGFLAPPQQAIRRACLATGLSKYTILKIRNEAQNATVDGHVDEYISHGDDEILGTDIHVESRPSSGSSQHANTASVTSESGLGHCVLVKLEPRDDNQTDDQLTTTVMKCEFEYSDEPLLTTSNECAKQDGLTQGSPHSTGETAADVDDVKYEYESDPGYDDELRRIALEQRRVKAEPAQEDIRRGGAAQRAEPERRKQAAETVSVQQAHQSRGDATTAPGPRRHQCTVCHKCFSGSGDLKRHFRVHTGEKTHECNICQRRFNQKKSLEVHFRNHTGEKPFECNICQKAFVRKGDLRVHLRIHTGEKPFECNICQRRFNNNTVLQGHIRTHTGEKPFECNICQHRFNEKRNLQVHIRNHTGERPFECNICQKAFVRKGDLHVHLRLHTGDKPFECNICQRRFSHKHILQGHLRTHTGEKPFECNICQRRCNDKTNLQRHLSTHTGEKPFACHFCKRRYSDKRRFQIHLRTHTEAKPF